MYRIYKETSPLSDCQSSSVSKEIVGSFSALEEAEERLQQLYDQHCPVSGGPKDFQVTVHDRHFPDMDNSYDNCMVHYWLQEMDFVYNGTEKVYINDLEYDSIDDFYHGLSVVSKYGKYGLIDLNFNLVLGLYYKKINRFVIDDTLNEPICRVCYTDEEKGWVDRNGRFIVIIGKPKNKEELLSLMGRVPSDNVIWAFKSECNWVRVELKKPSFDFDSAYSFYNVKSQSFAPALLQGGKHILFADSNFINGMAIIKSRISGKVGAINMDGKISVPVIYDNLSPFSSNGVAVFREGAREVVEHHSPAHYLNFKFKEGGKWGAINEMGEVQFNAQFDYAYAFSDGLAAVNLGGKYYVYLHQQPWFYLDDAIPRYIKEESFVPWFMGGKWGFVDTQGKECIPIQYDRVYSFRNGIAIVNIGGKWSGGSLRNKYDIPTYGHRRPIFLGGNYGLINKEGELVASLIYSSMHYDDSPNPSYIYGTIGGTLIEEDDEYLIEDPEKVVYFSLDGKITDEETPAGEGIRWPV